MAITWLFLLILLQQLHPSRSVEGRIEKIIYVGRNLFWLLMWKIIKDFDTTSSPMDETKACGLQFELKNITDKVIGGDAIHGQQADLVNDYDILQSTIFLTCKIKTSISLFHAT
ncbi:uncharacterized protein LOC113361646 [Papaver somniferum]|uniref:uncharacterized protein LOC113361646 n=1 Tax=Papaver somniferum TaxID=3469 RepID=UPI000E703D5F|nr:uncharacterized protein LOC113361646 [Papaver somniferum]